MASVTIDVLAKNIEVLDTFIDWYIKNNQSKLDIKTFLSLPTPILFHNQFARLLQLQIEPN